MPPVTEPPPHAKTPAPNASARASTSATSPPAPLAADIASQWALDPSIAFLNHGSFGARPRAILQAQDKLRAEFEASPIEFLHRTRNSRIDQAKAALAKYL